MNPPLFSNSRQNLANHLAMLDLQSLATGDFQSVRIEAQQVQDRGVDVGDIMSVLDRVEAQFVGGAVDDPALDTPSRHPDRKSIVVMIAAVGTLDARGSTEFGGENDNRLVKQPALFEIPEQTGHRQVNLRTHAGVVLSKRRMGIPGTCGAISILGVHRLWST